MLGRIPHTIEIVDEVLCNEIRNANYPDYIKGLEKYKPEFWHGYPSSFLPLAQYLIDNDIKLSFCPKYIQLSSENVTEAQLDKMGRAFGTRPIQGYAMTEQVATFREYPDGHMYVIEDLYAVEFLETETPEVYRVVGTNLTNYAMPLLRYDTRDLVRYKETEKGREILHIDGREEDNIKLRSGVIRRLCIVFSIYCYIYCSIRCKFICVYFLAFKVEWHHPFFCCWMYCICCRVWSLWLSILD